MRLGTSEACSKSKYVKFRCGWDEFDPLLRLSAAKFSIFLSSHLQRVKNDNSKNHSLARIVAVVVSNDQLVGLYSVVLFRMLVVKFRVQSE